MGEIFERTLPEHAFEWTGERLTTSASGQVETEHLHRYFFARALCRGVDVLDIASGEGYGAMLLAQVARTVVGVDVSEQAVAFASDAYSRPNLRFLPGDARTIPLPDSCVDVVVSFETLEHFYEHEQFIAEVRRVLRPYGRFIVSSPERDVYSPVDAPVNPYHVHELTREEFAALLSSSFRHQVMLGQRSMLGSVLFTEGSASRARPFTTFERRDATHFEASSGLPQPRYLVAIASDSPPAELGDSLYVESSNLDALSTQLTRAAREADELRICLTREGEQLALARRELVRHKARLAEKSRALDELAEEAGDAQATRTELHNRDAEVAWLRAELQSRIQENALILGSRSWKLTTPLRELAHGQPRGRARQAARVVRDMYRALVRPKTSSVGTAGAEVALPIPLPAEVTVLVAARGDNTLLKPYGPRARPFPHRGRDPMDSLAAIAQLEALRAEGASFLLLPSNAVWWLDHYIGFRQHLFGRYSLVPRPHDSGLLFNLREPSMLMGPIDRFARESALAQLDGVTDASCTVLDWHTDLDLASALSQNTVFTPPERSRTLPYMDQSVDIVAVRDPDSAAANEARRVASRAVVIFKAERGHVGTIIETRAEPAQPGPALGLPSASIVMPVSAGDPMARARLAVTCASLPASFQGELLVAAHQLSDRERAALRGIHEQHAFLRLLETDTPGAARLATADILVFLADDALPLSDWLAALLRTLVHSPGTAVVGGRVVASDGRLREAGGVVSQSCTPRARGAGSLQPDDPSYGFVREVNWCSRSVLATWRSVFEELGGFDTSYHSGWFQDADYCLRVRRAGHRVIYQPASIVVGLGAPPPAEEPDRIAFAQRWASVSELPVAP